ncbi:MAG: anthranilate phosphoribosyltransferase [Planctomycetota bacterium]
MIPDLLRSLLAGQAIAPAALEEALHAIMLGQEEPARIAALLVALATQPPQASTLAAAARVLRSHRVAVHAEVRPLIDTCGTGGDGADTFNISTTAALVVAAAGAAVAKHGNRAVSSKVGSADVLEAAGCTLAVQASAARTLLDSVGFVFLFAPAFHPAMAHVAPVRKSLGIRTLFNLLGPLANPALAEVQLVGVYDPSLTEVMARALAELGCQAALVVHCAGMDELGLHDVTLGHRVRDGKVEAFRLAPEDVGLTRAPLAALRGKGEAQGNLVLMREVLEGQDGPRADVVALNAGAALWLAGRTKDLRQGLDAAREVLRSGAARRVLQRYAESSRPSAGKESK